MYLKAREEVRQIMVKAKADTHVLVLEEVGVCPVQYYHCWIWKNLTAT